MMNLQFDPFRERLSTLELASDKARTLCDFWSLVSGLERSQQLDEQQKDAIRELMAVSSDSEFNDECQKSTKRLASIRGQLSTLVVGLSDLLDGFESRVQQGEELFETSNYHAGVRNLLNAEWEFSTKIYQAIRAVNKIVKQRLDDKHYPEVAVADVLVTQVYDQLLRHVTDEPTVAGILPPVVPIAWLAPLANNRMTNEALSGLPPSILQVDEAVCSEGWNLVKAYGEIARGVYKDFSLERDMSLLFRGIAPALSPQTSAILNLTLRELVADVIGTLLAGPSFVSALIERDAYTAEVICGSGTIAAPRMPTYFRWMTLCGVLRTMGFPVESEMLQGVIVRLYGPPEYATRVPVTQPVLSELMLNLNPIMESILQWPLTAFAQASLPQIVPTYSRQIHQRAMSLCEELITRSGTAAPQSQLKREDKVENTASSTSLSAKNRKDRKPFGKTENLTLYPEVHSTIVGIRLAFDSASFKSEDLAGLRKKAKETCIRFLDNFYGSPEGKTLQRRLSEDEARELVRRYKSASTRASGVAAGNIFQPLH